MARPSPRTYCSRTPNVAASEIFERFYDSYADAWETFAEFRHDVLEGLGSAAPVGDGL